MPIMGMYTMVYIPVLSRFFFFFFGLFAFEYICKVGQGLSRTTTTYTISGHFAAAIVVTFVSSSSSSSSHLSLYIAP